MNNLTNWKTLIIISSIAALAACGSDSNSDSNDGGSAVTIRSVSGTSTDITGTWKTVCYTSGTDIQETLAFTESSTVAYTNTSYASSDESCTGSANVESSYTAEVKTNSVLAITEWHDGDDNITTAPTAQGGSSLSDTESFTSLTYTLTSATNLGSVSIGDEVQFGYILDDTTTTDGDIVLYRLENNDPSDSWGETADPFIKQ